MRRQLFHYDLPPQCVAQHPPERRGVSRLLRLARDALHDLQFSELPAQLRAGDLLVFNNTRVIPARLRARRASGGRVEILVERILDEHRFTAQLGAGRMPRPGQTLLLEDGSAARIVADAGAFFELRLDAPVGAVLEALGHVPLPPYITRADEALDGERYQTVYARRPGAVAAPTAGLHFTHGMLHRLEGAQIELGQLTLHVGAGTFQPMRVEDLREHVMHAERVEVDEQLCGAIERTRARGGRVVAAGTTVARALEAASVDGSPHPLRGDTRLFIYPGYRFRCVDALLTNFHLPESTLLMLVCALGGTSRVLAAYRHAVAQGYRFFSYGDAMLLARHDAF